jgi:hypothetical protein
MPPSDYSNNSDNPHVHAQYRTNEHLVPKKPGSSADGGFFQEPPRLGNQFHDDTVFKRIVDRKFPLPRPRTSDTDVFQCTFPRSAPRH